MTLKNRQNKIAPVALFAYRRPIHLTKVLMNLKNNYLAKETVIHIFVDGAKNSKDNILVKEVKEIANSASGFKRIYKHHANKNYGLSKSIINGLNKMFENYENAIILEDDLIVSKYFLKYMNDGLKIYNDVEDVCSIHGYMYPHKSKLPETFFLRGADCWGWATWAKYWKKFEPNGQILLNKLDKSGELDIFDYYKRSGNVDMLKNQITGLVDSWAIRWHASMFLEKKYTLYPNISLVKNIGFDLSGTNSDNSKIFEIELIDKPIIVKYKKVEEDLNAIKALVMFYKKNSSNLHKIINIFRSRIRKK